MKTNSTDIQICVNCFNPELAEIIVKGLEPENSLLDEKTKIVMNREGKKIEINIESVSGISSLRYTVDDILNTISTIEKVYLSTRQLEEH